MMPDKNVYDYRVRENAQQNMSLFLLHWAEARQRMAQRETELINSQTQPFKTDFFDNWKLLIRSS